MKSSSSFVSRQRASCSAGHLPENSPFESYLNAIEQTLQGDAASAAVRSAAALPQLCSMLEDPNRHSSPARYIGWCEEWLEEAGPLDVDEPLTGTFLYPLHATRVIPRHLFCATEEEFKQFVCRAITQAVRRWYRQRGADDQTVRQNLGRSVGVGSGWMGDAGDGHP